MKTQVFAGIMLSILATGCKKNIDPVKTDTRLSVNQHLIAGNGVRDYQISKIIIKGNLINTDSVFYTYNAKGNPVLAARTRHSPGETDKIFRYDSKGRLHDFIAVNPGSDIYDTWIKYGYNEHSDLIARDTIFYFGNINDIPLPDDVDQSHRIKYWDNACTYGYDSQNRIIYTADVRDDGKSTYITHYYYDSTGNLSTKISGDGSILHFQYDNNFNMRSTHPIWQFIDRDYSVNNSYTAVTTGNQRLPTLLVKRFLYHPYFVRNGSIDSLWVEYQHK